MKGRYGYGTYPDGHIGCPRAKSDMTPCIARDGVTASTGTEECVGCGMNVYSLLIELVKQAAKDQDEKE